MLGEGNFGKVYKAIWLRKGKESVKAAVKMLQGDSAIEEVKNIAALTSEARMMAQIAPHENVEKVIYMDPYTEPHLWHNVLIKSLL